MGADQDSGNLPDALISLWMPDKGRLVFVGAFHGERTELLMNVSYEPPDGPFRYGALVRRVQEGPVTWPVIEGVTIEVKEGVPFGEVSINAKALAAIPLAELIRNAFDALNWDLESWGNGIKRFPPPDRGEGYPDDHYQQIAAAYRAAQAAGLAPRPFIMQTWRMSGAEVSRWIKHARSQGFLPPASKSAGGRPRHGGLMEDR